MPLSDIVNVQITRQTQSVSEPGFGTLMILGANKNWNDLIRQYTNMQQISKDFGPDDLEFIAAQNVFSQPITPPYIYIGRRTVDTVGIQVETAMPNQNYTVTINGFPSTISSNTSVDQSVLTLNDVTTTITYSGDFNTDNIITTTVNGTILTPVPWVTSQSQTLMNIASGISAAFPTQIASATAGTDSIVIVWNAVSATTVNSSVVTGTSPPTTVITSTGPLVSANLINVKVNGTIVGTVTSKITYSTAFTSGTSTVTTVNGVAQSAVLFNTNNATTLTDIASQLSALSSIIASATSNGTDTITVVFLNPGNNTINSSVTTGGSAPTAAISEGGFTFATSSVATMGVIATAIENFLNTTYSPGIATVTLSGDNSNVLTVVSNPNQGGVISSFIVTLGAAQATATIVNTVQPTSFNTIANALVTAINANSSVNTNVLATAPGTPPTSGTPNGTLSIVATVSGTPYTISVSTDIIASNKARIGITQAVPLQAYTIRINGYSYIYQAPVDVADNEQIALGLVTLINSLTWLNPNGLSVPNPLTGIVTAADNGNGTFEVATVDSTNSMNLFVDPFEDMTIQIGLIIDPYTPSASVVADLLAIQAVNDDWYALACTDRTVATVKSIAAWIETQVKIFGTASDDLNIINQAPGTDVTSIAYVFNNLGYVRTFVLYHEEVEANFPECAWFGNVLPLPPGGETWKFKTLNSISYSDLSSNQENNAFAKECNTYEYVGGVGITQNGTMAQGEYIDIIRGVDWLTSTIQSYVYSVLVNNPKVPYTDSGITAIESQIRRALLLGIANNFIASDPPYQIFVPLAANVPPIDKANRVLNGITFQATLAGAIHAVNLTGTVSV